MAKKATQHSKAKTGLKPGKLHTTKAEVATRPKAVAVQDLKAAIPAILERISKGDGLMRALNGEGMPSHETFYRWLRDDMDGLCDKYAQARARQAEFYADQIIEIADDSSDDFILTEKGMVLDNDAVQRSRLRVDARKWAASKLHPKKYGDKIEVEQQGEITVKHKWGGS